MAFRDVDSKTAGQVQGSTLTVPSTPEDQKRHNYSVTKWKDDNGATITAEMWDELCVIDDFEIESGHDERADLEDESARVQVRVTDTQPSLNTSAVRTDFMHWYWDLVQYTEEDLKLRAEEAQNGHPEGLWYWRMRNMAKSSRRMAQMLKALGYRDRLVNNGRVFRGLRTITDLADSFSGRTLGVRFMQWQNAQGEVQEKIVGFNEP